MIKNCETCGKDYKIKDSYADKSRYCSRDCMKEGYKTRFAGANNPNYRDAGKHICKTCGEEFFNYSRKSKYCSDKCKGNAPENMERIKRLSYAGGLDTIICARCGASFTAKPSSKRKFCTRLCATGQPIINNCLTCGVSIVTKPSTKQKFCTHKCANKYLRQRYISGVDHNQEEIVNGLRAIGAHVMIASHVGGGFPDLIVAFKDVVHLMEVKNEKTSYGRRGLNKVQQAFHDTWRGPVHIIRSLDDALLVVGVL